MTERPEDSLPAYKAPIDGRLTPDMIDAYRNAGLLILEDFVTREDCEELRERALELVEAFDPAENWLQRDADLPLRGLVAQD